MKYASNWSEAEDATVRRMVADGHSASEISTALGSGRTRSAVIGRVSRLGLQLFSRVAKMPVVSSAPRRPGKPSPLPRIAAAFRFVPFVVRDPVVDMTSLGAGLEPMPEEVKAYVPNTSSPPVAYLDLRAHHCRYIVDGRDRDGLPLSCGCEVVLGKSWCRTHLAIIANPARGSRQRPPPPDPSIETVKTPICDDPQPLEL